MAPTAMASEVAGAHVRERDRMQCPSIYATTLPDGRRTVRYLAGADDMSAFGGTTHRKDQREQFRARIVSARHGALDHGIVKFTPHTRVLAGDNFGHNHPVSRLVVVLEGAQTVRLAGTSLRLTPGSGILVPGDLLHSYEVTTPTSRLHVDIAADDARFAPLLKHVRHGHWRAGSPVLVGLAAFVRSLLLRDDSKQTWAERAAVRSTLEALVCSTISSAPPALTEAQRAPSHQELALQYIRVHHVDQDLTPANVAKGIGLSVRTLQRAFADQRSVAQWIAQFRVERALAYLRDPHFADMTIPELARRSGYGSTVALRRAVISGTGMPPSLYRDRHLKAARENASCHHGEDVREKARPAGHPAISV